MKQIEAFVDSVYQNVGGNKKEIQELKAEMKNHLLEAVHELKNEGKTEQEAIKIAIERFGGEQEMRSVVGQLFKAQKTFAKRVLYIAFTFLICSFIAWGVIWGNELKNANENSAIITNILSIVKNKEVISEDMKEEIEALVQDTDHISKVEIINAGEGGVTWEDIDNYFDYVREAKPTYQYERELWSPEWLLVDYFTYGFGEDDNEWFVNIEHRNFDTLVPLSLYIGFAVYATLFTIWAIINAYHHRRLNTGWVIAFALFNVIGYLVYFLVGKKVQSNTIS
ncbi:permease prefix domain 1-containing protein [Mesobacillus maritimus]|uniref:Cardiolipin synthase N-terminal domain-containing protein n=1 Tax=Mesobacillus maritimus TaxID=1643336 RepID=A0ABS7KAX2_9BACI|nr:permease prefix domain 1-containing protein [Mesobacillus maritimus]MBY0099418.1 hypothetical protein [Mesobacillus maritimus]